MKVPNKIETKEIFFAVLNDDGTYGEPILFKSKAMMESDLYMDSDHATEDM